jgi:hypothetical protein
MGIKKQYTVLTKYDNSLNHEDDFRRCINLLREAGIANPYHATGIEELEAYTWIIYCTPQELTILLLKTDVCLMDNKEILALYERDFNVPHIKDMPH